MKKSKTYSKNSRLTCTPHNLCRLKAFQKELKKAKVDLFVIEDPLSLFYFTGLKLSAGQLFIHKNAEHLFVDARYVELAKKKSPCSVSLSTDEEYKKILSKKIFSVTKRIGFDEQKTTVAAFNALTSFLKKHISKAKLFPKNEILSCFRAVKDQKEIRAIRKSATLLKKGFKFLESQIKEGITEIELVKAFEIFCIEEGAEALSFEPIVAFGPRTSMPHYHSGANPLKKGQNILIDIGIVVDGYCSDMTRMFFFGKKDPELEKIYKLVSKAKQAAFALCRPGVAFRALDKAARDVISKAGYGKHFLHSLGHGVGLEVHEYPKISAKAKGKLEEGMVITIEPGIYLSGKGGVRLEDMIVITKNGYKIL